MIDSEDIMITPQAVQIPVFLHDFTNFGVDQRRRLLDILELRSASIAIEGAVKVGMYSMHVVLEDDTLIDPFQGSMKRVTGKK
ncbi:unnamed protein product [Alternaria alternata]